MALPKHSVSPQAIADDEDLVQEGKQRLSVNAGWPLSKAVLENEDDVEQPWIQWPKLVGIELPSEADESNSDSPSKLSENFVVRQGVRQISTTAGVAV